MPYQSQYTLNNPYAIDPNAPQNNGRGWSGLGSLIGRGLRTAIGGERMNPDFDKSKGANSSNLPYLNPGVGRALAGDRGNAFNTYEMGKASDDAMRDDNIRLTQGLIGDRDRARHDDKMEQLMSNNAAALQRVTDQNKTRIDATNIRANSAGERLAQTLGQRADEAAQRFGLMGQRANTYADHVKNQFDNNVNRYDQIERLWNQGELGRNNRQEASVKGQMALQDHKAENEAKKMADFRASFNTTPSAASGSFLNRLFGSGTPSPQNGAGMSLRDPNAPISPEDLLKFNQNNPQQ